MLVLQSLSHKKQEDIKIFIVQGGKCSLNNLLKTVHKENFRRKMDSVSILFIPVSVRTLNSYRKDVTNGQF